MSFAPKNPFSRRSVIKVAATGAALPLTGRASVAENIKSPPDVPVCVSREGLANLEVRGSHQRVLLTEDGRTGIFRWVQQNNSAYAAIDKFEAIFIRSARVDVKTGCWVRESYSSIDPRWAGARADAGNQQPTDNGPILNACLLLAAKVGVSVHLPGAGAYGIACTIVLPRGVILSGDGCGIVDQAVGPHAGTTLLAMTALSVMVVAEGESFLRDVGLNGDDRALIGVYWGTSARASAMNVQAIRFTKHAYVLDRTQNGSFLNLSFRFNASGICLMNGARNNSFFNATGEVNSLYYRGEYEQASLITLLTDISSSSRFVTSTEVTGGGNDLNRFFGGIFERAHTAVRVIDRLDGDLKGARYGRLSLHDCELTSAILIDTTDAEEWAGTVLFRDSIIIGEENSSLRTRGSAGRLWFEGDCRLYGNAVSNRGIGLESNISTLICTRTHNHTKDPKFKTSGNATYSYSPEQRSFSIDVASSSDGLIIPLNGPMVNGNWNVVPATTEAIRPLMKVRFVLHQGELSLFTSENKPPYKTLIGQYKPGIHEVLHLCTTGVSGILIAGVDGINQNIVINNILLRIL